MSVEPGWPLAAALVGLYLLAVLAYRAGQLPLIGTSAVALVRAGLQLTAAAAVIVAALQHLFLSLALTVVMLALAVWTTGRRVDALRCWPWIALALAAGVLPALGVVFASQTVPFTGIAIIPVAGIVIGNAMTVHTLFGRRAFGALRDEQPEYDAYRSIGFLPAQAIAEITRRHAPDALLPGLDQARTAGVVTLPGAFIGVMLGGGSAVQAAAAQVLVLFALAAANAITVTVAARLVAARRILPLDLRAALRD